MRYLFLLTILTFSVFTLHSQQTAFKIGAGLGRTLYDPVNALGFNVQLDQAWNDHWTISGNLGFVSGESTTFGRSRGMRDGVSWDNTYEYYQEERNINLDISVLYSFFGMEERSNLKAGLGATVTYALFDFPSDLFINRGVIERSLDINHRATTAMMNIVVENDLKVSNNIILGLRGIFRTTFVETAEVQQNIEYHNGSATDFYQIHSNLNLMVQLGYIF